MIGWQCPELTFWHSRTSVPLMAVLWRNPLAATAAAWDLEALAAMVPKSARSSRSQRSSDGSRSQPPHADCCNTCDFASLTKDHCPVHRLVLKSIAPDFYHTWGQLSLTLRSLQFAAQLLKTLASAPTASSQPPRWSPIPCSSCWHGEGCHSPGTLSKTTSTGNRALQAALGQYQCVSVIPADREPETAQWCIGRDHIYRIKTDLAQRRQAPENAAHCSG